MVQDDSINCYELCRVSPDRIELQPRANVLARATLLLLIAAAILAGGAWILLVQPADVTGIWLVMILLVAVILLGVSLAEGFKLLRMSRRVHVFDFRAGLYWAGPPGTVPNRESTDPDNPCIRLDRIAGLEVLATNSLLTGPWQLEMKLHTGYSLPLLRHGSDLADIATELNKYLLTDEQAHP